ncbi:MAG: alpha/beta hydrolase [Deltaproteobacteria bacterium]|jgi:pimeloyl-ACP methyl ester carboxylesterase|nr:alpha/beta hydrolase [Deltaproteobacteria bacterium]
MGVFGKGVFLQRKGFAVRRMGALEIAIRAILTVAAGAVALMGLLYLAKDRLIFHPDRGPHLTGPPRGEGIEELFVDGGAGAEINAWSVPGRPGARTVLLFHGNGGSLENMLGRIRAVRSLGLGVFAIDYNGYGRSHGKPSERALELNAEAAWRTVTAEGRARPEDIVIWGYSLGGYPAAYLARAHRESRNPLILDSTFTRLADAASSYGLLLKLAGPPILGDSFDVRGKLADLSAETLLVFHSPADEVVPFRLGLMNFESFRGGPKELVGLYGGHKDFDLNRESYLAALERFAPRNPDEAGGNGYGATAAGTRAAGDAASDAEPREVGDAAAADKASESVGSGS